MAELAAVREDMQQAMLEHDEELQRHYKSEMNDFQSKIRKTEAEQQKLTETLVEVDKRKKEEFCVLKEQPLHDPKIDTRNFPFLELG